VGSTTSNRWFRKRWITCVGLLLALGSSNRSIAAEKVYVSYSLLQIALPVTELEVYANEGKLSPTLQTYAKFLKPEQLKQLREALRTRIDLSPSMISQFLYTPTGEKLLERAANLVKAKKHPSNIQALRSALILASAEPTGLTALNLFKNYPDQGLELDFTKGLEVFRTVQKLVQKTNNAFATIRDKSDALTVKYPAAPMPEVMALHKPGTFTWQVSSFDLTDNSPRRLQISKKPRQFPADLYVPRESFRAMPLIVISHGLGGGRTAFKYFAEHLASHGYVVAVPEHPGSSGKQFEDLLNNKETDVSRPTEFIDRPLDISFLLDELLKRNETDPALKGRINPDQIGVLGHSYGGYTAIALAGGNLTFGPLKQDCAPTLISQSLNLSLLLQCQALTLPSKKYSLADPRVKGVIAINSIGGSIFGEEGYKSVKTPLMLISATADTIATPLFEQLRPFSWISSKKKQLVLIDGATHFSVLDPLAPNEQIFKTPKELIGRTPEIARQYLKGLGLAFFETHIEKDPKAEVFLTPGSVQSQGTRTLPISSINSLTDKEISTERLW
jgi:predicted dienelactone hydrolase